MKAEDIVLKLMANMPKQSDKVSSFFVPDSISFSGKTVTVVKAAHGLKNTVEKQIVSITGALLANPVVSLVKNDELATISVEQFTDLNIGYKPARLESITEPSINGNYVVTDMTSAKDFTVSGFTFAGTIPNDIVLIEAYEISINDVQAATYVDENTFTFENKYTLNPSIEIVASSVHVHNKMRITRSGNIERMVSHYNANPPKDLVLVVVLGGTAINKDASTYSDADLEQGNQNEWEGMLAAPFHVYVFQTLGQDSTAGAARDDMSALRIGLYKSLLGQEFEGNTAAGVTNAVYPVGDDSYKYQKGYYIHDFEFSQTIMISREDTDSDSPSKAFKDVGFDMVDDEGTTLIGGSASLQE